MWSRHQAAQKGNKKRCGTYSEVVRLQACDAFKTEQPLLAQDRDQ